MTGTVNRGSKGTMEWRGMCCTEEGKVCEIFEEIYYNGIADVSCPGA